MTYHILTPLRRYENIELLLNMLFIQRRPMTPLEIEWHLIMDENAPFHLMFKQPWVHVYRYENKQTEFWKRCNFSINRWLDTHELEDNSRYCILNDDDAYEDGFFEKLDKVEGGLVIASMKRGDQTPPGVGPTRAHATNTLVAEPGHMKVGHVGVEQFFVKGEWLRGARLPLNVAGDGEMVQWLVATYGAAYVPDAFVLFNYFEPGRWNK